MIKTTNLDPTLRAAILTAARAIRLAEFNFSQELLEHDLSQLSLEDLEWCEKQVTHGAKFSYDIGLNSFTGERWRRERESKDDLEALASQALEETP